jgi:hypothetical protein
MIRGPSAAFRLVLAGLLVPAMTTVQGQAGPDPGESPASSSGAVLDRARAELENMTRRLARYACVETVERRYYQPPRGTSVSTCDRIAQASAARATPLTLDATDRLRLEVTLAEGREIHAWPGATRFDSRNVDQIINGGPIGTGSFGAHLIGVFDNPGVAFELAGETPAGDRTLAQFRYRVPLAASRYRVKTGATWQPIAYAGSFWVDAATFDLERFTLEASDLPAASNMCRVEGSLDYHRVRIGDGDVLMPRQAQMQIVMSDAAETTSVTTFGSCHEYQVETEVHFDTEPEAERVAAPVVVHAAMSLPLGLPVVLALTEPIDTDTAAVGDPVAATIAKPVRKPGADHVLIPAGTMVKGRITRLEHHYSPQPYFLIALSFNRLLEGDLRSPFAARYDGDAELAERLGTALRSRGRGLEYWSVGTFLFPTAKPRYVMPAGFAAKWETLAQ